MALGGHRQRFRCGPPPNEFNVSAATRVGIYRAGARIAVQRWVCANLGAHDQVLLGRWSGLMPSHQLQGRHPNLKRTQDAGALVGCMQ
jgi:hypothetical protein